VYSGLSLVYPQAGGTTNYIYASGLPGARIASHTASYAHQDALGSARAVTDSAGGIAWATQYKPFGIEYGTTGSGDSQLRFTGQWRDAATGLYYLFRRFYDPEVGRFLSPDRVLGHLTVPQSLNRYLYAVNNPLRYVDPTGEDWWNPLTWGQDVASAVSSAASAVGDWWASSSLLDKVDMAMTIVGFVPGLDVVSDAYFLGRAVVDVIQGRGSWQDVAMNAAFLLAPAVGGAAIAKMAKKFANAADSAGDVGRAVNKADDLAGGAKAIGKADNVGDAAGNSRILSLGGTGEDPGAVVLNDFSGARPRPGTPDVVIGTGRQMPFKPGVFTEVRANHFPASALTESTPEVYRVLQPGGKFAGITGSAMGAANMQALLAGAGFRRISVWSDDLGRVLWQAFK